MSRSSNNSGFTLIEAVAALVVVTLVLGGALAAAAADLRATRRTDAMMEGSALAEDLLFRTRYLQWDSLTEFGRNRMGRFPAPMDRYEWRVEMNPAPTEPALMDAVVAVRWNDGEVTVSTRFGLPAEITEGVMP